MGKERISIARLTLNELDVGKRAAAVAQITCRRRHWTLEVTTSKQQLAAGAFIWSGNHSVCVSVRPSVRPSVRSSEREKFADISAAAFHLDESEVYSLNFADAGAAESSLGVDLAPDGWTNGLLRSERRIIKLGGCREEKKQEEVCEK